LKLRVATVECSRARRLQPRALPRNSKDFARTGCPAAAPEHSTRICLRRDRRLTKLTAVLVPERPSADSPAAVVSHFRMPALLAAFALLSRDGRNPRTRTG